MQSSQQSFSSTLTTRDHHGQSSQLVDLCKRYNLSDEDIDKEVSNEHIGEIYRQLENWEQVAHHLGLSGPDIEAIECKAGRNVELMRLYTLRKWKSKKRLDGTVVYRVLLKALLKSGSLNSAAQVCKLLQKSATTRKNFAV